MPPESSWGQQEQAAEIFEKIRAARDELPFTKWEERARAVFRIGTGGG